MLSKFKYLIMMTIKTLQQKQVFIDQNQLVLQACIQIFYGQTSTVIKKKIFKKHTGSHHLLLPTSERRNLGIPSQLVETLPCVSLHFKSLTQSDFCDCVPEQ